MGPVAPVGLLVFKPVIVEVLERIVSVIPSLKATLKFICHQMLKSKQVASFIDFAKRLASDGMDRVNLFHFVSFV